jgi:hypothetical protein
MRKMAALALLAAGVASVGGLRAASATPVDTCTAPESLNDGWEAVFGRYRSRAEAERMLSRAMKSGFKVIAIERDACNLWEVEVAGGSAFQTKEQRHEFWLEAKHGHFAVSFEAPCCEPGNDSGPDWEAVFGHVPTLEAASALLHRAMNVGFTVIEVELDRPGDYEVEVPGGSGLQTPRQRKEFAAEARGAHFRVTFEKS